MELYPNPTKGLSAINYQISAVSDLRVEVLNESGQSVLIKTIQNAQSGTMELDVRNWSNGVYIVNIVAGEQRWVRKLIVGR